MPELERMLTRLGEELDWPPTPDLARRGDGPARTSPPGARGAASPVCCRRAGLRRSLALAAVALLLLAGTVFAAVPGVRDAVLDFFGLQGATVERRETLPTPPPERPLDLGARTTLADGRATARASRRSCRRELGEPDGVYVRPRRCRAASCRSPTAPRPGLPRAGSTRLGAAGRASSAATSAPST